MYKYLSIFSFFFSFLLFFFGFSYVSASTCSYDLSDTLTTSELDASISSSWMCGVGDAYASFGLTGGILSYECGSFPTQVSCQVNIIDDPFPSNITGYTDHPTVSCSPENFEFVVHTSTGAEYLWDIPIDFESGSYTWISSVTSVSDIEDPTILISFSSSGFVSSGSYQVDFTIPTGALTSYYGSGQNDSPIYSYINVSGDCLFGSWSFGSGSTGSFVPYSSSGVYIPILLSSDGSVSTYIDFSWLVALIAILILVCFLLAMVYLTILKPIINKF